MTVVVNAQFPRQGAQCWVEWRWHVVGIGKGEWTIRKIPRDEAPASSWELVAAHHIGVQQFRGMLVRLESANPLAFVSPTAGVSATSVAPSWSVILLGVEGIVRGRFLAVLGRVLLVVALLVGWHSLVLDRRIVLAWILIGASALLLRVNLRDTIGR